MSIKTFVGISAILISLSTEIELVQAQPLWAAIAPKQTVAPKKIVNPRSLITPMEIAEYRRAINAAPTREAKLAIREATYARLRQRAASRGMVIVESHPHPWYSGLHWGDVAGEIKPIKSVRAAPNMHVKSPVVPINVIR